MGSARRMQGNDFNVVWKLIWPKPKYDSSGPRVRKTEQPGARINLRLGAINQGVCLGRSTFWSSSSISCRRRSLINPQRPHTTYPYPPQFKSVNQLNGNTVIIPFRNEAPSAVCVVA